MGEHYLHHVMNILLRVKYTRTRESGRTGENLDAISQKQSRLHKIS